MILCKVLGTAVSTRKDAQLQGAKMLMVVEVDARGEPLAKGTMIVIEAVGAGRGDVVLVAPGSAANNTPQTANAPVDATAVAIVDTVSSGVLFAALPVATSTTSPRPAPTATITIIVPFARGSPRASTSTTISILAPCNCASFLVETAVPSTLQSIMQ